jgi:hypothetical protein
MSTEAKTPDPDGNVSAEPERVVASPSAAPSGTPERKSFRSGYVREKYRRQRLLAAIDDLKLENAQLRQDMADLEAMFSELKRLNSELAADLKARQRPSVSSFTNVLMGAHRG